MAPDGTKDDYLFRNGIRPTEGTIRFVRRHNDEPEVRDVEISLEHKRLKHAYVPEVKREQIRGQNLFTLMMRSPSYRIDTWNNDNRLVKVFPQPSGLPVGPPTTMVYNADGLRVRVEGTYQTLDKVWDLALGAGAPLVAETSGQSSVRRYAQKPVVYGDVLHQTGSGGTRMYLFDALGSTSGPDRHQQESHRHLYLPGLRRDRPKRWRHGQPVRLGRALWLPVVSWFTVNWNLSRSALAS